MNEFKTGDLILFTNEYKGAYKFLNCFNNSIIKTEYTHVGMVLKDPTFISPNLKGVYLWHSDLRETDLEEDQIKFGVKINPLIDECRNRKTKIFVRKIICNNNDIFNQEKLQEINNTINEKPYEVIPPEWLGHLFEMDKDKKPNHSWTSALIGYIYIQIGILDSNTEWGQLKPYDFTLNNKDLKYINEYIKLDNIQKLFNIDKNIFTNYINSIKQKINYFLNYCKKIRKDNFK